MGYCLDDTELYLFNTGENSYAYRALGCHRVCDENGARHRFAVWAPNAKAVCVVGDFNGWFVGANEMEQCRTTGVWQAFISGVDEGALYKYAITTLEGDIIYKADPFAFYSELRPGTASSVAELEGFAWTDAEYMKKRAKTSPCDKPVSIYEVHLASWRGEKNYREIADELVPYVEKMGFTHVELMPISEYPFDESWGYQVTGYYSVTARYGSPKDFMYMVDKFHSRGIGVIMDWVPAHFPRDEQGLRLFDGTACFEHADPRRGEQPDWGTMLFNYEKPEVVSFLVSNAVFWLDVYHADGLRVDAVSCILYLDYSKENGEWVPNKYGGHENLEAIDFLRKTGKRLFADFPNIIFAAEESTAFPKVTHPVEDGGVGFNFKWNMGWMHDILEYMSLDPFFRKWNHNRLTFSMCYAFSENYILSLSHDEVVHGKRSLLSKMPGTQAQQFASLRTMLAFMFAHPGKKLIFMGAELGEFIEWRWYEPLEWHLLGYDDHRQLQEFVAELNRLYRAHPALYEIDQSWDGFEWLNADDCDHSCIAFARMGKADKRGDKEIIMCIYNFTPVEYTNYRVGVNADGNYTRVMDSAEERFGGEGGLQLCLTSERVEWNGRPQSITLTLPGLSAQYFVYSPLNAYQKKRRAEADAKEELKALVRELKAAERAAAKKPGDKQLEKERKKAAAAHEKAAKKFEKLKLEAAQLKMKQRSGKDGADAE